MFLAAYLIFFGKSKWIGVDLSQLVLRTRAVVSQLDVRPLRHNLEVLYGSIGAAHFSGRKISQSMIG